jgi:Ser/Thr protein kinase RdoA (MazF antagonist)
VLRLDGHVAKIYADEREFAAARAAIEAAQRLNGVAAPVAEATLERLQLVCEAMIPGTQPNPKGDAAAASGSLLAALHRSRADDLRRFSTVEQYRAAMATTDAVLNVAPELADQVQAVLATLELTLPEIEELVPAHANFHAGQLLEVEGALAVIDFDHLCAAPAALDLSTYAARLVNGNDEDLSAAAAALDDLVEGYGSRPRGLSWYLATSILRRTQVPFTSLWPHWSVRTQKMVDAAEEALHL